MRKKNKAPVLKCENCGGPVAPRSQKCKYCGFWFSSCASVTQGGQRELDQVTAEELNKKFYNDRTGYEQWRKKWVASGGRDYGSHDQVFSNYKPRSLQQDDQQQEML